MPISLNPSKLENATQANLVVQFLKSTPLKVIERHKEYEIDGTKITFTESLIRAQSDAAAVDKFYIISNEKDDVLGEGAFSKARKITGSLTIAKDESLTYEAVKDKAVRIKNTQRAQLKRVNQASDTYQHTEALKEYEIAKAFQHLLMEAPVEVKKNKDQKPDLGEFSKSYSVMNALPGMNMEDFSCDFFDTSPNLLELHKFTLEQALTMVILPFLEAYKNQISDLGYVHRDIKPENILIEHILMPTSVTTVNFIDVDSAKKINESDSAFGSPGYLGPEVMQGITSNIYPPVAHARDIFALGILLIGCINRALRPDEYYRLEGYSLIEKHSNNVAQIGSYDPVTLAARLIKQPGEEIEFIFSTVKKNPLEKNAREDILKILSDMTSAAPQSRPSIEQAIQRFKQVLVELQQVKQQQHVQIQAPETQQPTSNPRIYATSSAVLFTQKGSADHVAKVAGSSQSLSGDKAGVVQAPTKDGSVKPPVYK